MPFLSKILRRVLSVTEPLTERLFFLKALRGREGEVGGWVNRTVQVKYLQTFSIPNF